MSLTRDVHLGAIGFFWLWVTRAHEKLVTVARDCGLDHVICNCCKFEASRKSILFMLTCEWEKIYLLCQSVTTSSPSRVDWFIPNKKLIIFFIVYLELITW